jgi:hypothetical protein
MALGVSIPGTRHPDAIEQRVNDFSASVGGHTPAAWSLWSRWGERGGKAKCVAGFGTCSFPSAGVARLHELGITPVIWWEPIDPEKANLGKFSRYKLILDGRHDGYIEAWAEAAREAGELSGGRRIVLRFAHEANGHWFDWGIGRFDNTVANFKAAWRHVWRIFKREGALAYVDFLWSVTKQRCQACNPFAQVFPGGKYIDYAGVTAFNWGRYKGGSWKSMISVLRSPLRDIMRVTSRPIVVSELASNHRGGDKAKWIRSGYEKVYAEFPRVKAILYLNTDQPKKDFGHPDWRLVKPADGSAEDAYADTAAKSRFGGQLQ